jgi:hypothetical protein
MVFFSFYFGSSFLEMGMMRSAGVCLYEYMIPMFRILYYTIPIQL